MITSGSAKICAYFDLMEAMPPHLRHFMDQSGPIHAAPFGRNVDDWTIFAITGVMPFEGVPEWCGCIDQHWPAWRVMVRLFHKEKEKPGDFKAMMIWDTHHLGAPFVLMVDEFTTMTGLLRPLEQGFPHEEARRFTN